MTHDTSSLVADPRSTSLRSAASRSAPSSLVADPRSTSLRSAESRSAPVRLHAIDPAAARQIVAGGCPDGFTAPPDYPAEGDRIAAGLFLEVYAADLDPRPYGRFLICLPTGGLPTVIGGIGFAGGPDETGRVEIGYGVVPSYQRRGYASAALGVLIPLARALGATHLWAQTDSGNVASQGVLRRNGFRADASLVAQTANDCKRAFGLPLC